MFQNSRCLLRIGDFSVFVKCVCLYCCCGCQTICGEMTVDTNTFHKALKSIWELKVLCKKLKETQNDQRE